MSSPEFRQYAFKLYNDDGSESASTSRFDWVENVNDITIPKSRLLSNICLRILIQEAYGKDWDNYNFRLRYATQDAPTTYYEVTNTSSPVKFASSTYLYHGGDCTQRLSNTPAAGTFLSDNNGVQESQYGLTNSGTGDQYFETLWCVVFDSTIDVNDFITFRVYIGSYTPLTYYAEVPGIRVGNDYPSQPTLISPSNNASVTTTPDLKFYATDQESNDLEYCVEIDTWPGFTNGDEIFGLEEISNTPDNISCFTVNDDNGDRFLGCRGGGSWAEGLWKQSGGTGSWVKVLDTSTYPAYPECVAVDENTGTVYVGITDIDTGTKLYIQSGGSGSFDVDTNCPTMYSWFQLTVDQSTGNLYAGVGYTVSIYRYYLRDYSTGTWSSKHSDSYYPYGVTYDEERGYVIIAFGNISGSYLNYSDNNGTSWNSFPNFDVSYYGRDCVCNKYYGDIYVSGTMQQLHLVDFGHINGEAHLVSWAYKIEFGALGLNSETNVFYGGAGDYDDTLLKSTNGGALYRFYSVDDPDEDFINLDTGTDTHPFIEGDDIQFTVPSGVLSADVAYYWRVKAMDPSGSEWWGPYSSAPYFITDASSGTSDSDSQSAYLSGNAQVSDAQEVYLRGKEITSDSALAYLHGGIAETDSQSAYLHGREEVSSNKSAYTIGKDSSTDNVLAYSNGIAGEIDNTSAYTHGKSTGVASFGEVSPYIKVEVVDAGTTEINGTYHYYDTYSGKPRYTLNGATLGDGIKTIAFIYPWAIGVWQGVGMNIYYSSTGPAVATPNLVETWSKGSYGDLPVPTVEIASGHAFTNGKADTNSFVSAFLQGIGVANSNVSGYLQGKDTASDSQEVYLTGNLSSSSSTSAFIHGKDTASSSKASYTLAGTTDKDSTSAYTNGDVYEDLPPASDVEVNSWKNELEGSTLWSSIDEYPFVDDDYAYFDSPGGNEYFEVALANPEFDDDGTGTYTIIWRCGMLQGNDTVTMKVELRQGASTVIASDQQVLTGSFVTHEYQLTQEEIDSITNFDDLRLRFIVVSVV